MKRYSRNLVLLAVVFLLAQGIFMGSVWYSTQRYAVESCFEKLKMCLVIHRSLHRYVEDVQKPAIYRLKKEGKLYQEYFAPEVLSFTFIARTIFQNFAAEQKKAGDQPYTYRLASTNPRNLINMATPLERDVLERVNTEKLKEFRKVITENGQKTLYVGIPLAPNKESCLLCHGLPEAAPAELVARYGDQNGFHEPVGQIRAIISLKAPLNAELALANKAFLIISSISASILLSVFLLVAFFHRTIAAQQEQLSDNNDQLTRSVAEKSLLIREMNHRIKNNLMMVQGLLSLQHQQSPGDDSSRELLQHVQNRIKSIAMIHERLYKSDNLTSINLGEYLRTLAEELVQTFAANRPQVRLECVVEDIVTDVQNSLPCGLIVNELISNALKYAFPTDEGVITLSLSRDGELLLLGVMDNGVGLPAGLDIYHTGSLGMKLVTSLTSQMNGVLEVSRSQGTHFRISFRDYCTEPLVEKILADSRQVVMPSSELQIAQQRRILIAEDDLVNRLYLQMILEGAGHRVVMAANGVEALAALAAHRVDLVLMDVEMPMMTGLEAVAAIRRGEVAGVDPQVPVYSISGSAEDDDIRRQRAAGMDGFLKKPFEAVALLKLVQESPRISGDVS